MFKCSEDRGQSDVQKLANCIAKPITIIEVSEKT